MSVLCTLVDCLSNVYQCGASWESNCTLVWTFLLALSSRKPASIQGRYPPSPPPPRPCWDYLRLSNTTGILQKVVNRLWFIGIEVKLETRLIWLHWWYVFSEVHIMWLPCQKPSSYSLLKFVYATCQLRHSLLVYPREKSWIRLCCPQLVLAC